MTTSLTYLNDTWSFYFHDPQNNDWRTCSYEKLCDLTTAQDFWFLDTLLKDNTMKGMFFLMREHVFPCWDDESNIKGGCISIKVLKNDLPAFWQHLVALLLTENILVDSQKQNWNKVNGISTSPKKHFCIVKIWIADTTISDKDFFNIPTEYYGDIIYKSNLDNISLENQRKV
jgi:hypothetical protein